MFWRFGGYASVSAIDSLLDKPDVSLEELLDESELIQELNHNNSKLIEYLREDIVLKRLMDYVIAPSLVNEDNDDSDEPNDDSNAAPADQEKTGDFLRDTLDPEDLERAENNRLQHAYVACEVLSAGTWSVLESIVLNHNHLRDFWSFLRRPPPLDSLQASYFTKVNETLFDRKTEEMLDFFKSLEGIIPAILQHIDNPMVMDLLLKIISLEKTEGGQGIVDWLKVQGLMPTLLSFLSPEYPTTVQTSSGDFIKAIITISANAIQNDQSCIGPNSLTRQLVSAPCMEDLIKPMLQGGNPLTVGVGIIIEVIRKNNSDYDPAGINGPDTIPTTYDPIYLGTLLRQFAQHIPDFMALIRSSKHTVNDGGEVKKVEREDLTSPWGAKVEPLGFDRFKTCELMAELLHCSNMGLLNQAGSEDYIRQRDSERERLIREGAFNRHGEGFSGADFNDSSADLINGSSVLGSGSPEDPKTLEVTNTNEEEGFEDVSAPEKDTVDGKGSRSQETKDELPAEGSKQGDESKPGDRSENTTSSEGPTGATSPSASGLTDKMGGIKIEGEQGSKEATAENQTPRPQEPASSSAPKDGDPDTRPMSSHPEDVPAPLFAKQQTESSTICESDPATEKNEEQPNDGAQERKLHPYVQVDVDGEPVVGDYLKIMFVEHRVVPTILGFFFRFPWNNFLHNVVYDVVQQVFNGPMERGYNRVLAVDVFETGRITQEIHEGQKRNDEAQRTKRIRLGYMGHLTLIAEEVVKFTERHPPELLSPAVMEYVLNPDWVDYVEQTLSETRERDNAILGGVRPDMSIGQRQSMMNQGQGFNTSSALAEAGLNGGVNVSDFQGFDMNQGSVSGGAFGGLGGSHSVLSGFASSSDDDEDEDMEDQDDRNANDNSAEGGADNKSANSTSQPIPILPPPPAPLSLGPSRARRQLAARLAAQKQQSTENNENEGEEIRQTNDNNEGSNSQWPSNPFVIAGLEDDYNEEQGAAFPSADFKDEPFSSPTFPDARFSPPDSLSTNSSEDDRVEGTRRSDRAPLEVDDDDEMGEMVGPSVGSTMTMDSDEEDEAIINESIGYPNLGAANRYKNFQRSRVGASPFGDDEEQNDSSDGEDEGLVEILVPGRKNSTSDDQMK